MPCSHFFSSVSQLVDDTLNFTLEAETRISQAAESFERTINVRSGLKDSPFNDHVANQKTIGAVTEETARASADDMSEVTVTDALKGDMYPKVGVYCCCTPNG